MSEQGYTSDAIEVLTGLDPVKKRPGMYTDTRTPNHLLQEGVDNGVDEAQGGYANRIVVTVHANGWVSVEDNGRGMPIDLHPEHGVPGVQLIMTRLHAGAKFSKKAYKFSGGLHGVGISVANALSTEMRVDVYRSGRHVRMTFEHGDVATPLTEVGTVPKRRTGTLVSFHPDPAYFDSPNIDVKQLARLLEAKAVLCPGLEITLRDDVRDQAMTWCYEGGLSAYIHQRMEDASYVEGLEDALFTGSVVVDEPDAAGVGGLDWAVTWRDDPGCHVQESYVNLIPTVQGGTHVLGFRQGVLDAIREFCQLHERLPKNLVLKPEDVWVGCQFVLSIKCVEPQFSGQTKERLSNRGVQAWVAGLIKDRFSLWLNEHVAWGEAIADWVIDQAQRRRKASRAVTRKKVVGGPPLPGKLTDCLEHDNVDTELFLVEGDSAGGSAKQARQRSFQAVLPLRGKILNTWEVRSEEVLGSQTVHDIAVALGVDPGDSDPSQCRYGKVCILADADSDGAHISTLLCALFIRHFLPLVRAGRVYVAMPPLYRIDIGKEVHYALDDQEKNAILKASEGRRSTPNLQRFKGLGEMNPDQLRETTMDPATRRLIQLTVDEGVEYVDAMDRLLSKKRSADRKTWLEERGDLATIG